MEVSTVGPALEAPGGISVGVLDELEDEYRGASSAVEAEVESSEIAHDEHPLHPMQDRHRPDNAHMFFNIYFMMTGLHGIHVLVGVIVITWLIIKAARGQFSAAYFTPVDLGGLYWHVVDLIWIFLFPLFYLI